MTEPSAEPSVENPHAGTGSVLLDIGGDVGALVVAMPSSMLGVEIEIHPDGTDIAGLHAHAREHDSGDDAGHGHSHHFPHVAVVERPTPSGPRASLVYGEVTEGTYLLCPVGTDEAVMTVEVSGGRVTEVTWPG